MYLIAYNELAYWYALSPPAGRVACFANIGIIKPSNRQETDRVYTLSETANS